MTDTAMPGGGPNPYALPRWDVSDVFPSLTSREYASARESLGADIARLAALFDERDVRGGTEIDADKAAAIAEEILPATNDVLDAQRRLQAFASSFVTTDARDEVAQRELAALQGTYAELTKLRSRFDAWVASVGAAALADKSPQAADHLFPLQRAEVRAAHQMGEAEEMLLADLQLTGSTAWNRLYRDVASTITVDLDGEAVPMSRVRALAYSPDGDLRRRAYEAELAAWEQHAVPIASALNAIKGETSLVNRRRGWADDLEPALAANNVDRATLDAMQSAVVASLPDFRRYLRTKAELLGRAGGLPFYDLFGPAPGAENARTWADATTAVESGFGTYSSRLSGLARRALEEQWIDAEPRDGKGSGAFCMGVEGERSLVLLNFDGSFRSVQTLAHELGHAYHNVNLADRTPLQRQTPMALAETASIFCETILVEQGLANAAPSERLALLEGDLQAACQVVVDIHSRFLFERSVFEARAQRTLSVGDFNALMLEAQEASYGDGLDPSLRHPFMWAAKPHYYGSSFYNWPYTFGLLFGIGLYAKYQEDPNRFRDGYDDLLASTGLGDAVTLGRRFGIDVTDEAFWTASLDVLRARIDEFCTLATGSP